MSPIETSRAGGTARVFRVPSTSGSRLVLELGDEHYDLSHGFEHSRHGDLLELVSRGFFDQLAAHGEGALARRTRALAPAQVLTPFEPRHIGKILALSRPPRELFEREAAGDGARWFSNRSPASLAGNGAWLELGELDPVDKPEPAIVQHECFLALVISRRASGLDLAGAAQAVAGAMLASDFSRRTLDGRPRTAWFGESHGGMLALGPAFVPRDSLDLSTVHASVQRLRDGRVEREFSRFADLSTDVPLAVAALSRLAILHPGDLVLIPLGLGLGAVDAGDEIRCQLDGIGELVTNLRRRARLRQQA